jgi:hypothetical protein
MADPFKSSVDSPLMTAKRWITVTPNDGADLPGGTPKALWVNGSGNLSLVGEDGNAETFAVVAGAPIDLRPARVRATGTTATDIKALY